MVNNINKRKAIVIGAMGLLLGTIAGYACFGLLGAIVGMFGSNIAASRFDQAQTDFKAWISIGLIKGRSSLYVN
ncbi:MAG: hypothetical protein LBT37_01535 [Lactobacillaceae bacterium]|jgi:hypothetical protein|nr:hypothetical protein [Lactobacillaceae bacterium]